ncbi:MAG: hypothetical protein V1727_01050 [Candidatus Omnitrophota bacterium]
MYSWKKKLFLICVCLLALAGQVSAEVWEELKGEHFLAYYQRNKGFAKEVLEKAEEYYKQIALDLGYARSHNFWSWDSRVKIYLFPDNKSYLTYIKSLGYPEWAVGMADYSHKEIISFNLSNGFLDTVLPHEITHLMFRDYVGGNNIPLWIDEGVAQWSEKGRRAQVRQEIKKQLAHHSPIPMDRMMSLNIGQVDNDFIVELYYVQAVSMIDFLISRFGADKFIYLCRQLRDGKEFEEALRFAYPNNLRDPDDLQLQWTDYLGIN